MRLLIPVVAGLAFIAAGCPQPPIDVKLDPPAQGFQLATPAFPVPERDETQRCYFFEVPSDVPVYVKRFEVAQNSGTHHMNIFRVKTVKGLGGRPGDAVIEGECWKSSNWSDWPLVVNSQESNPGAPNPDDPGKDGYTDWTLPEGVAMRLEPHEILMLQSHYVDAATQKTPLHGRVLANFHTVEPASVKWELGTLFATNQSIKICPGETSKYFETTCRLAQTEPVDIIAANSHFHSRGTYFSISVFDPQTGSSSAPFYETRSWDDPPMARGFSAPVPPGGGVSYRCEFSVASGACGNPDHGCCFTFGGKVETQEHCNIFVYYYPKTRDVGCF